METGIRILVYPGFKIVHEQETGLHLYVDADFHIRVHSEPVSTLKPETILEM